MNTLDQYMKEATHLVVVGTFINESTGLCAVPSPKDPKYFRELACHSASAEMAMRPLAKLCRIVFDKFPPKDKLRRDLLEIVDRLEHATSLLEEAVALDNPDRRESFEK